MLTWEHVERAIKALESGRLPDAADVLHLSATWRRWRAGVPWPQAVGVSGPLRLAQRNAALRQAAEILDDGGLEPWVLAGHLEQAMRWFAAERWPSIQSGGEPENPLDGHLADALKCGQLLGRRQLCEILRGEISPGR